MKWNDWRMGVLSDHHHLRFQNSKCIHFHLPNEVNLPLRSQHTEQGEHFTMNPWSTL